MTSCASTTSLAQRDLSTFAVSQAKNPQDKDDLKDLVSGAFDKLTHPTHDGMSEGGLFMRPENCSPKDATCRLHNRMKPQSPMLSTDDTLRRLNTSERAVKDITRYLEDSLD